MVLRAKISDTAPCYLMHTAFQSLFMHCMNTMKYQQARAEITKAGYQVSPLPGPSAITAAVSGSGDFLNHGNGGFQFLGFLPAKANQRDELLKLAATSYVSSFFYEAPHRIESTLKFISNAFDGDRKVLIAKELSKIFEEIKVLAVRDLPSWIARFSKK
ncbi:MAG: rRNA ((1402)-2-O)-methyltransferase [Pseudomonadota bacterium]